MPTFQLNDRDVPLSTSDGETLIDVLRDHHGLTGTKLVCGAGVCGACTVTVDGKPAVSCLIPCAAVAGRRVRTIEGLGANGLHPVQRAFMANDALQCGFCTPGFIVEAVVFHDAWRASHGDVAPNRNEIAAALAGHLCRCGAYAGIYRAVTEACTGRFDAAEESAPRIEAKAKVTGAAKYTVDIRLPGQLEGAILRSQLAHARVKRIDCSPALAVDGVAGALALVTAGDRVRYFGESVAAVAARDIATAKAALARVKVDYEALPSAIGYDAARAPKAPRGFRGLFRTTPNASEGPPLPAWWHGNVRRALAASSTRRHRAKRMIAEAKDRSDPLLVENLWRVDAQQHTCFEPHSAVAHFNRDQLTVYLSTQATCHLGDLIAKRFRLPVQKVRIVAEHVGGAFGSKLALTDEAIAAVSLAREVGAPVRVAFDRNEELSVAGYRPGAELAVSLLPAPSGELEAMSIRATADTGLAVNSNIASLGALIYTAQAKDLVDCDVVSHLPPGTPFRGPGGPVLCFALEQAVDEAAERLNIDPIALRQLWDSDQNRGRLYAWARHLPIWRERRPTGTQSGRIRSGIGVAAANWLYLWQPDTEVELALCGGRLVVRTGVQDSGMGSRTVLASTIATAFGLAPSEVEVSLGDSTLVRGPNSAGSRTTPTIVPAALAAAELLKAELQKKSGGAHGAKVPWRDILTSSADVTVRSGRPEDSEHASSSVRSPFAVLGLKGKLFELAFRWLGGLRVGRGPVGALMIAEVEVDCWLGHARVTRVFAGLCGGRVHAPALAQSQVEGSIIQGVGYALHEGRQLDAATGAVLTAGLEDYRIPGIGDAPEMHIHFDEDGFDHVAGGGVGIGEVATLPVSAAIANAIYNATGRRPRQLPIRPDRLLALLDAGRTG